MPKKRKEDPVRTTDQKQLALIETAEPKGKKAKTPTPSWVAEFGDALVEIKQGTAPYGRIGKALKPLVEKYGVEPVRERWLRFISSTKAQYGPEYFATNYSDFASTASIEIDRRTPHLRASNKPIITEDF